MLVIYLAPLLALAASAIQVTAPSNSSGWTTDGSQEIKWNAVSTDPSKVNIQLINPASPNDPIMIAENVDTFSDSYTYTPSSALEAGSQYRVNLVGVSNSQQGILAQSGYFEVKQGQSSVSASATSRVSGSQTSKPSQTSGSPSASSAATTSNAALSSLAAPSELLLLIAGMMGVLA